MAGMKFEEDLCISCGRNMYYPNVSSRRANPALFCSMPCNLNFRASGVRRFEIDSFIDLGNKEVFLERMESLPVPVKLQITSKDAEEGTVKVAVRCVGSMRGSFELLLSAQGPLPCDDDMVERMVNRPRREEITLQFTEDKDYSRYYKKPAILAVIRDVRRRLSINLHGRKTEEPRVATAEIMLSWKKLASHRLTYNMDLANSFGLHPAQLLPSSSDEDWMRLYNEITGQFQLELKDDDQNSAVQLTIVGNLTSTMKGFNRTLPDEYEEVHENVTGEVLIRQYSNNASTSRCPAALEFSGTLTFKSKESTYKVQIIQGWMEERLIQKQDNESAETTESKETQITMILSFSGQLAQRPRQLCEICKVNVKAHATWPCLHFLCQNCSRELASKIQQKRCPICFTTFTKTVDLGFMFD